MLAQPRRKQRLAADPQNQTWRQDDTSVGHKLLAKMGWSEGKGLGKDGSGNTEYVRVKPNWELAGIGAGKEQLKNDSYAQLTNFDALLKDAWKNAESCDEEKEKRHDKGEKRSEKKDKKEKRSKKKEKEKCRDKKSEKKEKRRGKSRDRKSEKTQDVHPAHLAHRSKFIRNKQVGQYSEERLKEILVSI